MFHVYINLNLTSLYIVIKVYKVVLMQNIYNMGGRSFWIHNTGPIGCLPYMLTNFPVEKDEAGCLKSFNEVAQYFNFKLNESIVQLRKDLPLATFIYVDVYSVKYSLFTSPNKYGEPPIISYVLSYLYERSYHQTII